MASEFQASQAQQQRERLQDPDDPDDLVDTTARKRRRDVWSDGLREAALANDKLYAFARQLGGAIGEPISEVAIIDDSKLAAESKQLRDARQRASQRAAEQHADLVKTVIAQVIKDSQLQLGINDQGSAFAGTSTGAVDLTKLKIVSGTLRREASDLAGLGKEGETDRFFGNAVKLESLLRSGTGEMSFSDLLAQLRVAGQQLQQASMGDMDLEGAASSTSIEYLSSPRNSLMLRWRPEALAAVREAVEVRICDRHGCNEPGNCPAPKSPNSPDRWYFCEKHAAEYNKGWDYFQGLNKEEAEARAKAERSESAGYAEAQHYGWSGSGDAACDLGGARCTTGWRRDQYVDRAASLSKPFAR